jgi:hypothetical protein
MITILSAVICLRSLCYSVVIPTPATLEFTSCIIHFGQAMAQRFVWFVDSRWTIKLYDCEGGSPWARSSMSAGDVCSPPARPARQDGVVWRHSPRSWGWHARPSVGD